MFPGPDIALDPWDGWQWKILDSVILSTLFIFIFSRLSNPPVEPAVKYEYKKPPRYLAHWKALHAAKNRKQNNTTIIYPIPFSTKLPQELQLLILSNACDDISLFRSLVRVGKKVQDLTYRACLPQMPLRLVNRRQIMSFDRLLFEKSYVAELVRHLWISPPSEEDYFPSFRIVSQCTNIRTLGCNVRLLYTAVLNEKMLKHMQCRSLTIIGPDSRRWEGAKCGGVFFHHLTHLRISGDMIPETLQFERLTHLSYMNKNAIATMQAASSVLEDATRYPVLEIVVVTQETSCTGNGTSYARLICPRLILYQHARALPEVETWCDGIRGMTIWDKAKEEVRSVRRR